MRSNSHGSSTEGSSLFAFFALLLVAMLILLLGSLYGDHRLNIPFSQNQESGGREKTEKEGKRTIPIGGICTLFLSVVFPIVLPKDGPVVERGKTNETSDDWIPNRQNDFRKSVISSDSTH